MKDSPASSGPSPEAPDELPLWKAALAWCDPTLVEALLKTRAECARELGAKPRVNPFPLTGEKGFAVQAFLANQAGVQELHDGEAFMRLLRAGGAVEDDFRRHFAASKITLKGLQLKPKLGSDVEPIPPAWARMLKFDWIESSVRAADTVFIEVTGALVRAAEDAVRKPVADIAPKARRGSAIKGRPPFPMAEFVTIAAERLGNRAGNNKLEATELLKVFMERHSARRPPGHRTVCDHVNDIYRQAGETGGSLNPLK